MANFNQQQVIGRIGQEVRVKEANGTKVAEFSVATNETYGKGENRKTITTWFNVEAWEGLAGIAESILKPGVTVFVQGRLRADNYEKEGLKVKGYKLVADTIQVFDPIKSEETKEA